MTWMDEPVPADSSCTLAPGSSAPTDTIEADVCVVGGGVGGLCAALAAARSGVKTVLVQDRPVLGGNASSEIRMWICGAHGNDNKEAGYLEEIQLENQRHNPRLNYAIWDSVLYGKARSQPNLTTLLNCSIVGLTMAGEDRIAEVRGWHLTRQRWQVIKAKNFIDCSGDSILRLSGAPCRWGREASESSGESLGRPVADRRTMGNTVLIQLREIAPEDHRPFLPPGWALRVDENTFAKRKMQPTGHNFWWLEIGGLYDTIADADRLRDDLMALAMGVWAFIKNHPDGRGHSWELEWIGALPGKRENVRYEGDHILTQHDIEAEGRFPDVVAHGGWTMDDHPPAGIYHDGADTTHHRAPSPYGIPYRSLYSRTVKNLWFAGRNISATHLAMSSTRVMATCATMGQAAGAAAAISIQHGCDNRGVYSMHLERLQRWLMDQDQWLPGRRRPVPALSGAGRAVYSSSCGDAECLRDGVDRAQDGVTHRWDGLAGDWVQIAWSQPTAIPRVRLVGDSLLNLSKRMPCSWPLRGHDESLPAPLPRDLRFEVQEAGGAWRIVYRIADNDRRLITWTPAEAIKATALRVVLERPWGTETGQRVSLFAFEVGEPDPVGPVESFPWPKAISRGGGRA